MRVLCRVTLYIAARQRDKRDIRKCGHAETSDTVARHTGHKEERMDGHRLMGTGLVALGVGIGVNAILGPLALQTSP